MSEILHNTLTEQLLRVEMTDGDRRRLSLPEVYAALAADAVETFPALRAHQAPAWMAFLTQVAAMGLEASGLTRPPGDEPAAWAEALRALTSDWSEDEPWALITPPDRPALLQAPVPNGSLAEFRTSVETPDALDMLVTSKNHDLKADRMAAAEPDDWLFALVSLQTQEGRMGAGNDGVARMNGGYGSRPFLSVHANDARPGAVLMRNLRTLVAGANRLHDTAQTMGIGTEAAVPLVPLVWTEPWDGSAQLSLAKLHPLFVEVCRRVRLDLSNGRIVARRAGSKTTRIAAKDRKGNLADPWAPVEAGDEPKALSITENGFSYKCVCELLFGSKQRSYQLPLLATVRASDTSSEAVLDMAALARGQGETKGFHARRLAMPARAASLLEAGDAGLAKRAEGRVRDAGDVMDHLRLALICLAQKGRADIKRNKRNKLVLRNKPSNAVRTVTDLWAGRFDNAIDRLFFPELWRALDWDDTQAEREWVRLLAREARRMLAAAAEAIPRSEERRIIAIARARNLLESSLRKHFPALRDPQPEEVDDA